MAIDQPLFFHSGLYPIAFEKIECFDEICVVFVQKLMRIFGGFDRHAVARQHVKMCGFGKFLNRCFDRMERGLNQRPFSPTTFHALLCEGDILVFFKCGVNFCEMPRVRAGIKVNGHAIACSSQQLRLPDDGIRVFVAQQDVGDFGQGFGVCSGFISGYYVDKRED